MDSIESGLSIASVSVITVNFNTSKDVHRTIRSVLKQDYPFEWVIVDGGSSDESGENLRNVLRPNDRFVSEPDRGIADAFSKALRMASGEAVIFMNAGDEFADNSALSRLVEAWDRTKYRWVTGTAVVCRADGAELYTRFRGKVSDPWSLVRKGCRVFHQATIAERTLFTDYGDFDPSYRTSMDYDLWLRWMAHGCLPQVVDVVVCRYRVGGVSSDVRQRHREEKRSRLTHGFKLSAWQEWKLSTIAMLKHYLRYIAGPVFYRIKERLRW